MPKVPHGIEYMILVEDFIRDNGEHSCSEIANKTGWKTPTITRAIQGLVRLGRIHASRKWRTTSFYSIGRADGVMHEKPLSEIWKEKKAEIWQNAQIAIKAKL